MGAPMVPLPFTCHTVVEMAKDDGLVLAPKTSVGDKCEVLFPVGLPDEGTFDWLDQFLEKNPHYTELSDRQILKWAEKSGLWRPKTSSWKNSNDKPDMNFGIPMMDDFSVRRVLNSVISTQPRNYVVMEVKSNLIAEERAEPVKRFCEPHYKKIAQIVVGEPPNEFKMKTQELMLAEKKEQAELEWRQRKTELEQKKIIELRQLQMAEARRAAELVTQKKNEVNEMVVDSEAEKKENENV